MRTRQEFIDQWKHELAGMVLDAATAGHGGAPLAIFCREIMKNIDKKLGSIYDDLVPPPPQKPAVPQQNGKTEDERKAVKT